MIVGHREHTSVSRERRARDEVRFLLGQQAHHQIDVAAAQRLESVQQCQLLHLDAAAGVSSLERFDELDQPRSRGDGGAQADAEASRDLGAVAARLLEHG
jgi:hypothetical protein